MTSRTVFPETENYFPDQMESNGTGAKRITTNKKISQPSQTHSFWYKHFKFALSFFEFCVDLFLLLLVFC